MYTAKTSYDWERLAAGRSVEVYPVAAVADQAEFVSFKDRPADSYGEYYQDDREMHVIFKVGDRYFKKFGEKSSYGDVAWDGPCVEVFPQEKVVTEYVMQPVTKTVQVFE